MLNFKITLLFALLALIVSCTSCNLEKDESGVDYFFDFDELIHYRIEIDENVLLEKEDDVNVSPEEELLIDLVLLDRPTSIVDTAFIDDLEKIGFAKTSIDSSQFSSIRDVFREKEVDEVVAYACVAVYRDVLIFKKNGRITGMAKICFDCGQSRIYGTSANTGNFGQDGDYAKLNKMLNQ